MMARSTETLWFVGDHLSTNRTLSIQQPEKEPLGLESVAHGVTGHR